MGSDRHLKVSTRSGKVGKHAQATYESKFGEAMAECVSGIFATGVKVEQEKPDRAKVQTPSVQRAHEGFNLFVVQSTRALFEATLLTQDPIKKRRMKLGMFHVNGMFSFLAQNLRRVLAARSH